MDGQVESALPVFVGSTVVDQVLSTPLAVLVQFVASKEALDHLGRYFLSLQHFAGGCWQIVDLGAERYELALELVVVAVAPLPGGLAVLVVDSADVVEKTPALDGLAPELVFEPRLIEDGPRTFKDIAVLALDDTVGSRTILC